MRLGFTIKEVIGVGNLGTTMIAYDEILQANVVLKVYHVKNAITSALNEFKMLHAASNCKNTVLV